MKLSYKHLGHEYENLDVDFVSAVSEGQLTRPFLDIETSNIEMISFVVE